jgi:NAD(P)-dependent dehydrogenase (short-subunit alcohol dehydrogenase family)
MTAAIVIGGSSGIGRSAARQIAARGSGVIVTYNNNRNGGLETVNMIERAGGTAVALALDLNNLQSFARFKAEVVARLEQVWGATSFDHLVNNAGFAAMATIEDTSERMFDESCRVLLKGPFFLTQALLPILADGGAIVNVTSSAALPTGVGVGYSVYGSLKAALITLTQYMAKELSSRGIRVNAVAPGPTRSAMTSDAFADANTLAAVTARTAFGRVGEPDDIGRVIAMLVSDEARWMTGQSISVSGGFNL